MSLEESLDALTIEDIETHEPAECSIVQPNGAVQVVKDCWCRLYHAFGNQISFEHVEEHQLKDNIYCLILKSNCQLFDHLPFHQVLFQKLGLVAHGPAIFYKKGYPLSLEETQKLFQSKN